MSSKVLARERQLSELEIKKGVQENDGASIYYLVNTVETAVSRMSSTCNADEMELFNEMVDDDLLDCLLSHHLDNNLHFHQGQSGESITPQGRRVNWYQLTTTCT